MGSDNGLASNRQQTIIWTNADLIHWRIYAELGGDELNKVVEINQILINDKTWMTTGWNFATEKNTNVSLVPADMLTPLPLVLHICISEPGLALVQVMACHLLSAKPSPESILTCCQLDT